MKQAEFDTRDWLAIDRTKMANERTFLAYLRTFLVILGSGVAIVKVTLLDDLTGLGWILILLAPLLLIFGIIRFCYVRRHIQKYYRRKNNKIKSVQI